ncbi:hypothetical protein FE257_005660 [Aspergillus nanangensis]|uniref:Tat pathway signal sequence n=1 Tax=Aspergillus nanangensis TaxID=2582783 RepID=A0AAD4CA55_ASPNN|nr:hypothetical protein FE257_005660 [Aspergillus nanangensis]
MASSYVMYSQLKDSDEEQYDRAPTWTNHLKARSPFHLWALRTVLGLSLFINAGLVFFVLSPAPIGLQTNTLYSPAQWALRYRNTVFDSSFGIQTTAYQGPPSETNNALWSDLYNFGITRISADEARDMANKTLPIPNDADHYIISLSVFHQLHCLNQVRKGLYGDVDWTDQSDHTGITHLDHCVDIIRQGLMCNADITPLTWTRDGHDGSAKEVAEVIHTCRDFEAIRDWAKARQMVIPFDKHAVVEGDPLGWGGYAMSS